MLDKKVRVIPGESETPAKRRGRPPGSTNKPKPVVKKPSSTALVEFTVVQQWDNKVVINIPGEDLPYRIPEKNFVAATIRWGFNVKGTRWPLILTESGIVAIDWEYGK